MSDTPRTDAAECIAHAAWRKNECWTESGKYIPSDFARTLERELAAAERRAEHYREKSDMLSEGAFQAEERAEKAEQRAEAMRKDAERYRWLRMADEGTPVLRQIPYLGESELDAAIDAAMKEKK